MTWTSILALAWLAGLPAPARPGPSEVAGAISVRRSRVEEFRLIKVAAEELGIRVWLFGGTAAGFAHYVRWDMAREAGDARYRESFFDYDFTNIYRSTQDADLVIDGTLEQAEALEGLIRQKMSFLQGSKEHWEVRLLREDRVAPNGQVKQALLHNPDFLEQNTDSNSTGMVELTDPTGGEGVVRDLRDWESPTPLFLTDVTEGRLHYYLSPTHRETSRFLSGDNPPICSVIRYLVKAFQYDLQIEGEDREKIQAIIDEFDSGEYFSSWAAGWLERYAPNLIRHAVNIEYAWDTLEELGLREKLISLSSRNEEGSLGWWLSREPLRTAPVGQGSGKTAVELGLDIVAHETRDFLAYESITRDTTLRPNVLISRPGYPGESAVLGEGFYTRRGRVGAAGTGLTIRFRVDPKAREGADFTVHQDYVLFTNRAALQVIPESLDFSAVQYFEMLRDGRIDPSDRGILTKLKRRLSIRPQLSREEEEQVLAIASQAVKRLVWSGDGPLEDAKSPDAEVVREWFALPAAVNHPELLSRLLEWKRFAGYAVKRILPRPGWERHPEIVRGLIQRREVALQVVEHILTQPSWKDHPQLVNELIDTDDDLVLKPLIQMVLSLPSWGGYPESVGRLLERESATMDPYIAWRILETPHWNAHPEWVRKLLDRERKHPDTITLTNMAWSLKQPHWKGHLDLVLALVAGIRDDHAKELVDLYNERTAEGCTPSLGDDFPGCFKNHLLSLVASPNWRDDPTLRALCSDSAPNFPCVRKALRNPASSVQKLLRSRTGFPAAVTLLSDPGMADHPRLVVGVITRAQETGVSLEELGASQLLELPHWRDHPFLRSLCRGDRPTVECLSLVVVLDAMDEIGPSPWSTNPECH